MKIENCLLMSETAKANSKWGQQPRNCLSDRIDASTIAG
jgi:hypothetical protein